jgi:hypothetical protein
MAVGRFLLGMWTQHCFWFNVTGRLALVEVSLDVLLAEFACLWHRLHWW